MPKRGVLGTRVGPATGDASAIALWLGLLLACIGTIVWLIMSRKKKSDPNGR
jgi:LPXTG-motif cell wall-anchored protein